MIKIITIFLLAAASNTVMSNEKCNKDSLMACLNTLETSVKDHLHDVKSADKSSYCQSLEQGGKCVEEASQNCKEKYPQMSKLISSFYVYLTQACTETYADVAHCMQNHESDFEKCKKSEDQHEEDPMKEICREVEVMQCVATVSMKVCENGKIFGKAIEDRLTELRSDICSAAGGSFGYNYWILTAMLLVLFFNK